MDKYGTPYPLMNEDIQNKTRESVKQIYNVDNVFQLEEIKEKIKHTNLEKYGVQWYTQTDDWRNKAIETNNIKYNCDFPTQNKDVQAKIRQSFYKNGTGQSSKIQRYLHELIGGELNYPFDYFSLDVAFPSELIYVEYDGGGHTLTVKKNVETVEQFLNRERRRSYYLKGRGWKQIKIISEKDNLPCDKEILMFIEMGKDYLLHTNHTYFEINIDNNIIWCKEYELHYRFKIDKPYDWFVYHYNN